MMGSPFNPHFWSTSESPGTRMRWKARGDGNHRVLDPEVSSRVVESLTACNVQQIWMQQNRNSMGISTDFKQIQRPSANLARILQNSAQFNQFSRIQLWRTFQHPAASIHFIGQPCNAKASGREHVIRHGHRFSVQLPTVRAILGRMLSWRRVWNSCHPSISFFLHLLSAFMHLHHLPLFTSIHIYSQISKTVWLHGRLLTGELFPCLVSYCA